jgi:hypothetical protein
MVAHDPAFDAFILACWAPEPGWIAIPTQDGAMRRQNQYAFYHLGKRLGHLACLRAKMDLREAGSILYGARGALGTWLHNPDAPIDFSRPKAEFLLELIRDMKPLAGSNENEFDVADFEIPLLLHALGEFEEFYSEELSRLDAYVVTRVAAYDTNTLVDHAEQCIPEESRSKLPATVTADMQQAGRCLAFALSTAAGFHALRACEAAMHAYLEKLKGKPLPSRLKSWGDYLGALNANGANRRVTAVLEQVREKDRNPIMHPEETLDQTEAVRVFGVAQSALIQIAAEL